MCNKKKTSFLIFLLFLLAKNFYGQGFLVNYPKEPRAVLSANYTVFVNEVPVPVYVMGDDKDVSYTHFAFAGKVTIRIHVIAVVSKYNLSPHGYGIVSTKVGQDISFDLDRPRKLLLQDVNSLAEHLCILADPLEENPPKIGDSNVVNIMTTGIDNTGASNGLNKIQNALNNLPPGGILYFPPGRYSMGGDLMMKSNRSIYLAGGAALQASATAELRIIFSGVNDAKLFGRGSIDGRGDLFRPKYSGEGGNTILYCNSESDNCRIEDIIIKGAISWTAIVMHTTNWTVYNMKVINGKKFTNRDSWDPHNAINMMMDNLFLYGNDDALAYSVLRDNMVLNTTIRNSVLYSLYGATIRVGPWIGENTSNFRAENNDHVQGGINEYALAFWVGGAISNIKYLGNRVEVAKFGLTVMRTNWNDHYAGPQCGSLDSVFFDHLTVEKVSPCTWDGHLSQFEGASDSSFVKNIFFKDFYQKGALITSAKAADINLKGPYVSNVTFGVSTTPVVDISATELIAYSDGSIPGKFTISRTGGNTDEALTVNYVIHGTAINGTDYTTIQDFIIIPAESSKADILITPDKAIISNYYRTVFVSLASSPKVNYIIGSGYHAVVTILNGSINDIDNQAPTTPINLKSSSVSNSGFILSWAASTDNIDVAVYEIFKNGIYLARTSDTTYIVDGLTASNEYEITIRAWDHAGNASVLSNVLNVSTLSTGIPDSYLDKLSIYPNPVVNHKLLVDLKSAGNGKEATIRIINVSGRQEFQTNIPIVKKATISLPDSLAKGLYIISITSDKISSTNKIVIE